MHNTQLFTRKINEMNKKCYIGTTGYSSTNKSAYHYTMEFKGITLVFLYCRSARISRLDDIKILYLLEKQSNQLVIVDFTGLENYVDSVEKLINDMNDKQLREKEEDVIQYLIDHSYYIRVYKNIA